MCVIGNQSYLWCCCKLLCCFSSKTVAWQSVIRLLRTADCGLRVNLWWFDDIFSKFTKVIFFFFLVPLSLIRLLLSKFNYFRVPFVGASIVGLMLYGCIGLKFSTDFVLTIRSPTLRDPKNSHTWWHGLWLRTVESSSTLFLFILISPIDPTKNLMWS